ncbi:MAG: 1-deoxy-D-xylulose-5-phosphate synthase [Bacteroidales bacterium]|jgi:1-deoxy-D-xylulose-5-phosphate synthase|nr:1-deoxy-D-xylulose-5-phosphate synthase [Bacteroidales bacterium]
MTSNQTYTYLDQIDTPDDLRKLSSDQLIDVCCDIRKFIIEVTSIHSGHLGASLGAVDIAVALHYVFNTPDDRIIWDVGHQAYAHKILTGRKSDFHANRQYGGISGFPKMSESIYDAFGTGHSSTAISAALGMAISDKLDGNKNRQNIAVVGDGSMTGGMAFEAMNHGGEIKPNMLIVLNDNGIAIDKSVGALKEYLLAISSSRTYNRFKHRVWNFMTRGNKRSPRKVAITRQLKSGLKSTVTEFSNLFEALNWRYFGPIDGHDVASMVQILTALKAIPGPKILHTITKKGKGLTLAEENPVSYHAPEKFDISTGIFLQKPTEVLPDKYQDVFGETIIELAQQNPKIVGITPAMPTGCSLNMMMEAMPERTFDVGIAEQHAVTFAAGLAAAGKIPFCNIYSSFMQRAYDQVIHDIALQQLPVVLCLDRGGLVGEDGPTHHGAFDLAYFRAIPNMTIAAPMNELELRNMMYTAQLDGKGPFSIRYPRGRGVLKEWRLPFEEIPVGKGRKLREGKNIAIITIGHPGNFAAEACEEAEKEGILVTHYDMRFLKPIDEEILREALRNHTKIITVEDGTILGGLGGAVMEFAVQHQFSVEIIRLGIPDRFIDHGSVNQLYKDCKFDKNAILQIIKMLE